MDGRPNRAVAAREQSEKESGTLERGQAVSAGCGAFVMDGAAAGTGGHLPDQLRNARDAVVDGHHGHGRVRARDEEKSTRVGASCPRTERGTGAWPHREAKGGAGGVGGDVREPHAAGDDSAGGG